EDVDADVAGDLLVQPALRLVEVEADDLGLRERARTDERDHAPAAAGVGDPARLAHVLELGQDGARANAQSQDRRAERLDVPAFEGIQPGRQGDLGTEGHVTRPSVARGGGKPGAARPARAPSTRCTSAAR